jgi:CRISPR-associated endonuclease Cas1
VLTVTEYPWLSVYGFGAHIKSTQKKLIIQRKGQVEEYPLESVKHLLLIGGHNLNSATVTHLLKNGSCISFFEPDGTPVGIVQQFGPVKDEEMRMLQQNCSRHRYALTLAQSSLKSRLFSIDRVQKLQNRGLFYEGESEFLQKSLEEISFLIKIDEIRRLHRLTTDMYYEIMSRSGLTDFGFRRRTPRPYNDPVNAMLSFGYSMLFGNCCVALTGAGLDPDSGFTSEGKGSLVYDLIEPLKTEMIDEPVFAVARESLKKSDFEQTQNRCLLSDEMMKRLIGIFQTTLKNNKIEGQVYNLCTSLKNGSDFNVMY